MPERLVHYSSEPLTEVRVDWTYEPGRTGKPSGFWFSVETDDEESFGWREWCESEGFYLERLAHVQEVVLVPDVRILRLSSAEDIDVFTARYGAPAYPEIPDLGIRGIDWNRVKNEATDEPGGYQGIIIAPYVWERRLSTHTFWYYGWDCASGCVWDLTAIAELRPLGTTTLLQSANDSGMMVLPTNGDQDDGTEL